MCIEMVLALRSCVHCIAVAVDCVTVLLLLLLLLLLHCYLPVDLYIQIRQSLVQFVLATTTTTTTITTIATTSTTAFITTKSLLFTCQSVYPNPLSACSVCPCSFSVCSGRPTQEWAQRAPRHIVAPSSNPPSVVKCRVSH